MISKGRYLNFLTSNYDYYNNPDFALINTHTHTHTHKHTHSHTHKLQINTHKKWRQITEADSMIPIDLIRIENEKFKKCLFKTEKVQNRQTS